MMHGLRLARSGRRVILAALAPGCIMLGLAVAILVAPALVRAQTRADLRVRKASGAVARHLGIFLAVPDRREAAEGVRFVGGQIEIWFLRPVAPAERDAAVCDGARWLISGRLGGVDGIGALFDELPEVDRVTLVFYELRTRVKPIAKGRYEQIRSAVPRARFSVTRERAQRLNVAAVRETLRGARCARAGRTLLDAVRLE